MNLIELIWNELQRDIARLNNRIDTLTSRTERSETAGGVVTSTLAEAPLSVDGSGEGDMLWISDGRKVGEGAGAGTGVMAYYNPSTDSWFRTSDDTAVAT